MQRTARSNRSPAWKLVASDGLERAASALRIINYCDMIAHFPELIRYSSPHAWSDAERLMDANENVMHEID